MSERVDQLIPWGYAETQVSTFHAFGDRVLREWALELGLDPQFRVLSQPEQVIFLRERLFKLPLDRFRPLGDPTRHLAALTTLVSRAKDEDVSPGQYRAWAEARLAAAASDAERDEARSQLELAAFYEAHQRLLAEAGLVDFGDQIHRTLELLAHARGRARAAAGALPLRARGRVPGHEPRAARDARAALGPLGQPHGGGRRRPGDLPLARRGRRQPDRVPPPASGRARGGADGELPLDAGDPRHLRAARPLQQPAPARGELRHRQAPALAARGRRTGAPSRVRHGVGRGRRGRRDDRGTPRARAAAARLRDPGPQQRRRRPVPARAQRARPAAPLQRQPRPLRARGDPAARLVPQGARQPGRLGGALLPGGLGALRASRDGSACASITTLAARPARCSRCCASCRGTRS